MQPTITCKNCGTKISIDEALLAEIKERAINELSKDHRQQIEEARKVAKAEAENEFKKIAKESEGKLLKQLEERHERRLENMEREKIEDKKENEELREQLKLMVQELRAANKARQDAELEAQKKLAEDEQKIRAEAEKEAAEKQHLHLAQRDKTIMDLQRALEDAQRKASQGSQQMQGEVLELELERTLSSTFGDDEIVAVEKGEKGADVCQHVRSPRGRSCGIILWETKRTKNWTENWIDKLKSDCMAKKAHIPVLITEIMPKGVKRDIELYRGVWVARPNSIIPLALLLRKVLLDVERQKAITENPESKSDALFTFVTSHEFAQQVESMVETYDDMRKQVQKERTAYSRLWAQRESQAQRLLEGTASIIGAMQGQIGHTAMPRIKGLELMALSEASE